MRKLVLLFAAGTLWLFLAAIPAFADGGPHVASTNNGVSNLTADTCAGCHRVHTAQGPYLLKAGPTEDDFCVSCHGAATPGATTDVMTGIQYRPNGNVKDPRSATPLGALRGGGFVEARIGDPFRVSVQTSATGSSSRLGKVLVQADSDPVNSAHIPVLAGLDQPGVAWGNGANGSGAGPAAEVGCGSCHNPHGNNQYRILNTIPGDVGIDATWGGGMFPPVDLVDVVGFGTTATDGAAQYNTSVAHGLAVNNKIVVKGNALTAANVSGWVDTIVDADTFTLRTSFVVTNPPTLFKLAAGTTLGGTVLKQGAEVFSYTASSGKFKTVSSHGLLTNDEVTISGNTSKNGTGKVTVTSDTEFTVAGISGGSNGTGGTAVRNGGVRVTDAALPPAGDARNYTVIQTVYTSPTLLASQADDYSETAGDYFHYRIPWNDPSSATNNYDAPNAIPGGGDGVATFAGGFGEQVAAWCTSCHTRYYAWSEPTDDPNDPNGTTGAAYSNARPGDNIFKYQHRTRGASGRGCLTCHVSHGSNAEMTGEYSSTFTFPDGTPSNNSRLLKVDNRGTCQQCHEPTGTAVAGDQFPSSSVKFVLTGVEADTDTYTTAAAHTLVVGDQVSIANLVNPAWLGVDDWTCNGQFFVVSVTGNDFQVSKTKGGAVFNVLQDGLSNALPAVQATVGIIPQTP